MNAKNVEPLPIVSLFTTNHIQYRLALRYAQNLPKYWIFAFILFRGGDFETN